MAAKGDNALLTFNLFKAIQDFLCKYQYRGMVQYICQTSKVTVKEYFWINTRNCKREWKINKHCIFKLFGAISQESATDVRESMVECVRLDPLYYKCVGHVILGFKNVVLNEWCDVMARPITSADELAMFA